MRFNFVLPFILLLILSSATAYAESVKIQPSEIIVAENQNFTVRIVVEVEKGVSGGEINLKFDPDAFEVISLKPGDLFGENPLVGVKRIENGTIKYALARVGKSVRSSGDFAVVSFRVKAESGSYTLQLTKVGLADEKFEDIEGIETGGAIVKVQGKEEGEKQTPGFEAVAAIAAISALLIARRKIM